MEPGHCVVGASGSAGFVLPLVLLDSKEFFTGWALPVFVPPVAPEVPLFPLVPVLLGALLVPVVLVGVGLFH